MVKLIKIEDVIKNNGHSLDMQPVLDKINEIIKQMERKVDG